ncbi:cystatin-F [Electrophorus electricus]|uniref:Cystatin domain-containing protein n=2 Tax=Electrophorus TaxID=8004 RepID=A0A4W4G5Y5_ELEEL|nr:cystatin-F [Electrophorus electricus]
MDVCHHFILLFLLAGLCSLEAKPLLIPGKAQNISKNDAEVKKAILTATYSFNNESNDAFFFKKSAVNEAQKQVVKGVKYILKMEISRTVCKKREINVDLDDCAFQTNHRLQQTFHCNFEVWAIPWLKIMKTTFFICNPLNK